MIGEARGQTMTARSLTGSFEAGRLIARAALFRTIAAAFTYPNPGHAEMLRRELQRAAAGARRGALEPGVAAKLRAAHRAWLGAAPAPLAARYLGLFAGSGPVSLHETAYGDGRRVAGRAVELADINGFYRAFGLVVSENDPDLPDHLGAELEFVSALLLKEAHAAAQGKHPQARLVRDARRKFLQCHLGRWLGALADSLTEAGAPAPYRATAALLRSLVESECRRLRARVVPVSGRRPFDSLQDENFTCPMEKTVAKLH